MSSVVEEGTLLLSVGLSSDEVAPEVEENGSLLVIGSGTLGGSAGLSWAISALLKKVSWALVLPSEPGPWRFETCSSAPRLWSSPFAAEPEVLPAD